MSVSKSITDVLKKIKDPHIGKDIVSAKMVKNIKVVGKTVTMTLVMPDIGCAGCGMVFGMIDDIKSGLKKKGYKAEIEVGQ